MRSQNPSQGVLNHLDFMTPTNITIDYILYEHPKCKHLAYNISGEVRQLKSVFRQLLIAENYRGVIPFLREGEDKCRLKQQFDNFYYNSSGKLFLLNQAANRIEADSEIFNIYKGFDKTYLLSFKRSLVSTFKTMEKEIIS